MCDAILTNRIAGFSVSILVKLSAVVANIPASLLPSVLTISLTLWLGSVYMKAQLPVKRIMSNAKSPILATFGGAIASRRTRPLVQVLSGH